MSYDYNALVSQIEKARRDAAESESIDERLEFWQGSVEAFEKLSAHCPMTPLLWMQYALDTSLVLKALSPDDADKSYASARLQLLQLGLSEFPGSAILQLHYLQLMQQFYGPASKSTEVREAMDSALSQVCKGAHRNEAVLIAPIWQMDAANKIEAGDWDAALHSFRLRASTPMKDVNSSLSGELQQFASDHQQPVEAGAINGIENGRRYEALMFQALVTYEDEVDVAMHSEGVLARHHTDLEDLNWTNILQSDGKTIWMGLGGMATANAFISYAQAFFRYRIPDRYFEQEDADQKADAEESRIKMLAINVYERGVAECPTVENIWVSYVRCLNYFLEKDMIQVAQIQGVIDRAIRNCPYSTTLVQKKIKLHLYFAKLGQSLFDPDEVMKIAQDAVAQKFIVSREATLQLYLTALGTMRRRMLTLLEVDTDVEGALSYDSAEPIQAVKATNDIPSQHDLSPQAAQEIDDLCDDTREAYDTVDAYLRKQHSGWSKGRAILWSDRAYTETHLLGPLSDTLADDTAPSISNKFAEACRCHEKLTKVYQPSHPDSFRAYIDSYLGGFSVTSPCQVLSKLRQVRSLYQKALKCVAQPKDTSDHIAGVVRERDYESALNSFCHEYLVFEQHFGSDKSVATVSKIIEKKVAKFQDSKEKGNAKRTMEVAGDRLSNKRAKLNTTESSFGSAAVVKVKIGDLEYPSHPFTVKVSQLPENVRDMELVDAFVERCGPIVHARVIREKSRKGLRKQNHKGWGLIQFEERSSVEKALGLSDEVAIQEKVLKVERSHMPAAMIIPREVRSFNVAKPCHDKTVEKNQGSATAEQSVPLKAEKSPKTKQQSVLHFKPRGVKRKKPKSSL